MIPNKSIIVRSTTKFNEISIQYSGYHISSQTSLAEFNVKKQQHTKFWKIHNRSEIYDNLQDGIIILGFKFIFWVNGTKLHTDNTTHFDTACEIKNTL